MVSYKQLRHHSIWFLRKPCPRGSESPTQHCGHVGEAWKSSIFTTPALTIQGPPNPTVLYEETLVSLCMPVHEYTHKCNHIPAADSPFAHLPRFYSHPSLRGSMPRKETPAHGIIPPPSVGLSQREASAHQRRVVKFLPLLQYFRATSQAVAMSP